MKGNIKAEWRVQAGAWHDAFHSTEAHARKDAEEHRSARLLHRCGDAWPVVETWKWHEWRKEDG